MLVRPHTLFILVGPSNCGKSLFATRLSAECDKQSISNEIVSSDQCRRELLGASLDKMDPRMMEVSQQAFKLLHARVDLHSQWPVNTEVIIVDSTALDLKFQEEMISIAKKNNYNVELVLFDYKNRSDYLDHIEGEWSVTQKEVTLRHVDKFRKRILPNLPSINKTRIKSWGDYSFGFEFEEYRRCFFVNGKYLIVADVHGCYDELLECLASNGVKVEDGKIIESPFTGIILVGDFIDKTKKVRETVDFLFDNRQYIANIMGNHENYIYKRLYGDLKESEADSNFDSVELLRGCDKFKTLVEKSYPFIKLPNAFISHAPCHPNEACKMRSLKEQRNFRHSNLTTEQILLSLQEMEGPRCGPIRIFGHIQFERVYKSGDMIGIDTGVCYGNELTSVSLD